MNFLFFSSRSISYILDIFFRFSTWKLICTELSRLIKILIFFSLADRFGSKLQCFQQYQLTWNFSASRKSFQKKTAIEWRVFFQLLLFLNNFLNLSNVAKIVMCSINLYSFFCNFGYYVNASTLSVLFKVFYKMNVKKL